MTRTMNEETIKSIGATVRINSWVNSRRDMGKIVFLDMRDRTGILQVICVPSELDSASSELLSSIRSEYVLEIEGVAQERNEKQRNPALSTGTVELLAKK